MEKLVRRSRSQGQTFEIVCNISRVIMITQSWWNLERIIIFTIKRPCWYVSVNIMTFFSCFLSSTHPVVYNTCKKYNLLAVCIVCLKKLLAVKKPLLLLFNDLSPFLGNWVVSNSSLLMIPKAKCCSIDHALFTGKHRWFVAIFQ